MMKKSLRFKQAILMFKKNQICYYIRHEIMSPYSAYAESLWVSSSFPTVWTDLLLQKDNDFQKKLSYS